MTINDVLDECRSANIHISVVGGGLRVTNASALTGSLRAGLKQHKSQLVRELSLPLLEYTILLFPGSTEIANNGKKMKIPEPDGGLF